MEEKEIVSLIKKARAGEEDAIELLFSLYKSKVTAISREYFLNGSDFEDIVQEGMIGLNKAIQVYSEEKNHNFGIFASLCIHRQIQNAVKNANRKKNNPLNSYLPIKYYDGSNLNDDENLLTLVIVDDTSDIEKNFINKETEAILMSKIKDILSKTQFDVLKSYLNGESYDEISRKLNLSTKQVDNQLQAIKKKVRAIKGEIQWI